MNNGNLNNPVAVALGNFDGLHLGHMAVLDKTLEYRIKGFTPCVVLFDVHPQKSVCGYAPPMLMTAEERNKLIKDKGMSIYQIKFDSIKSLSPERFVDEILISKLNAKAVICGYNYRFGEGAEGTSQTLRSLCKSRGLDCSVVDEVDNGDDSVSSTIIRTLIENGEVERASAMLGRDFGFSAEVINGDKRGRKWGFPTINQILPSCLVMPKFGVYSTVITIDGKKYSGVTNIGKRPTVGTNIILSETNILDFNRDIYGKTVDIRLKRFIRPEIKFKSFDDLARQIESDVLNAKRSEKNV